MLADSRPIAPITAVGADAEVVGQILADYNILVLAQLRYGYKLHTAEEFEIVIANVDAILRNIDASLH